MTFPLAAQTAKGSWLMGGNAYIRYQVDDGRNDGIRSLIPAWGYFVGNNLRWAWAYPCLFFLENQAQRFVGTICRRQHVEIIGQQGSEIGLTLLVRGILRYGQVPAFPAGTARFLRQASKTVYVTVPERRYSQSSLAVSGGPGLSYFITDHVGWKPCSMPRIMRNYPTFRPQHWVVLWASILPAQKMRLLRFLLPFLCLMPASLPAQTVSGYVTDSTSGEALVGAALYETGSQRGTVTNKYGFYSLSLPGVAGQLTVSYLGYKTAAFKLPAGRDTVLHVKTGRGGAGPARSNRHRQTRPAGSSPRLLNLPVERLKSVPVLFGEPDLIKALALTPGVSIGLEGTSGLLVRGGTQDQNLILLDEATVYNVSHLFGLVSAINPDAIKNVDLYKAGFPARYGGRLSSVLDITMKEGNNQARKGEWSIGWSVHGSCGKVPSPRGSGTGPRTCFRPGRLPGAVYAAQLHCLKAGGGGRFVSYWMYDANLKINHKFRDGGQLFMSFYRGNDFYRAGEGDDKQRSEFGLLGQHHGHGPLRTAAGAQTFFRSVLTRSSYQYGIDIRALRGGMTRWCATTSLPPGPASATGP
jgi:hypothetical protein